MRPVPLLVLNQLAFPPSRGTIVLGVSNLSSGRKPTFLLGRALKRII
jgi:hypothetical protein